MHNIKVTKQGQEQFALTADRAINRLFDGFKASMGNPVLKGIADQGLAVRFVLKDIANVVTKVAQEYRVTMAFTDAKGMETTGVLAYAMCDEFDL